MPNYKCKYQNGGAFLPLDGSNSVQEDVKTGGNFHSGVGNIVGTVQNTAVIEQVIYEGNVL